MAKKLVKGVEEELTCTVCLGRFTDPRVLPCQHTYCQGCIEALIARSPEKSVVACPSCREKHPLPESGVAGFVANFSFNNLLELLENHTLYERAKRLRCENGLDENTAVAQCLDCNIHLCDDCWKVHQKMVATRNHQTVSHEELRRSGEKLVNILKPRYCPEHKNQVLRLYCKTCFQSICGDCTRTQHHNHKYVFLEEEELEKKQEIATQASHPVEVWPEYETVTTHIHLGKDAKSLTQHHQATIHAVEPNPDPLPPPPLPPQHPSHGLDSQDLFERCPGKSGARQLSIISGPACIDILLPLEDQPWYHGSITRAEAEEILREQPDGSFLVRNSESCKTGYSLSIQLSAARRDIRHLRIEYMCKERRYLFGMTGKKFHTVPEGINLYTTKRLNVHGSEHSTLKYPVPRLYDHIK